MSSKKLINSPTTVVDEALEGLTMINPGLRLLEGHRVVIREKVRSLSHTKSNNDTLHDLTPDRDWEGEPHLRRRLWPRALLCWIHRARHVDWRGGWECLRLPSYSLHPGGDQGGGQEQQR